VTVDRRRVGDHSLGDIYGVGGGGGPNPGCGTRCRESIRSSDRGWSPLAREWRGIKFMLGPLG